MNMKKILIFSIISIMLLGPLTSLAVICAPCTSDADCVGGDPEVTEECDPIDGTNLSKGGECQDMSNPVVCVSSPLKYTKIEDIIDNIVNYVFYGAMIVAPLMIAIAAVILMTSAGDTNRVTLGKKIIIWSVVGFLIILASRGIISLILHIIGA